MPKKQPELTIECRTCRGSGREPLPVTYQELMKILAHDWQSTAAILAQMKEQPKPTTLVQRLAHLEEIGLAGSRSSPTNFRAKEWKKL